MIKLTTVMRRRLTRSAVVLFAALLVLPPAYSWGYGVGFTTGKVVDFITKKPIQGAIVTSDTEVVLTDEKGIFKVKGTTERIRVRAHGYARTDRPVQVPFVSLPFLSSAQHIELVPFTPKALYLTVYGIGSRALREAALKIIDETEINSLVIDVKGDRGFIPFKSSIPVAAEIGAQKVITVKDMKELVRSLKEKGIYTIARIVVFKDNLLALARPDLAVRTTGGEIWHDRERLAWVDPFKKDVWDYNISVAIEAAQSGFDEIQFDYIRFPDAGGVAFSMPSTEENRVGAITGFLAEARKRLSLYNVFIAADIFGYVCWNLDDTKIGQRLDGLAVSLDYMSPMLYPSGFKFGIPGYRIPVAHAHEIVYLSLKKAQDRTRLPTVRFRPWLQAFRDYAFDRREFKGQGITDQIRAAEKFGSHGWMLWNPRNVYSTEGLKKKDQPLMTLNKEGTSLSGPGTAQAYPARVLQ
ncbi:MAG TPA: putative glycoside hydrolase [Thermodesulfovibrionales bacterium]|nr:putative glycoside hydrolase [Thermodesulfovibrionales bacterium]